MTPQSPVKSIDFTRKMTFRRAMAQPIIIAPVATAIEILFLVVNLILAPIGVLVTAHFIDTALNLANAAAAGYNANWSRVAPPLAAMVSIELTWYVLRPFRNLIDTRKYQRAWYAINFPMVATCAAIEAKHIENRETKNLIDRAWNNPMDNIMDIWHYTTEFLLGIGRTLSYLIILMASAPLAGIVTLIVAIPVVIMAHKTAKDEYKARQETSTDRRLFGGHQGYLRNRESACERSLFGYAPMMYGKFLEAFHTTQEQLMKKNMKWVVRNNISAVLITGVGAIAVFMMLPGVEDGSISVGTFIALMGVLFATLSYLSVNASYNLQQITRHTEYLKEFNQYLELSRTSDALVQMSSITPKFEKLELRDVSFTYPDTDKVILKNLSLTIEAGKRYSLVGANGCGKTTLAKLLIRLYDEYTGEILLNGRLLQNWPMSDVKAMFTMVFQDFVRYEISVADNIATGSCFRSSPEEIDRAIEIVGLTETVAKFSDGKDTELGKIYDAGIELSGGQWQKIAMARVVASPAMVKILDEPTASLDPMAEQEVYAKFDEISRGAGGAEGLSATIFISHRLASAKMADVIYVMDSGQIIESGSHEELMEKGGLYAEMFESQRGWYV